MGISIDAYLIFKKIILEIGFILLTFFVIVFIYNYIRLVILERKIKLIHKNQRQIIEKMKQDAVGRGILKESFDMQVNAVINKNKPDIEELERKRKFIHDKMPFFFK